MSPLERGDGHREDAALYIGYAEMHLRRGEYEQAENAYCIALRFESRSLDALTGLTRVYLRAGRLDDAARAVQQALAIAPDDPPALKLLGEIYAKRGRFDLAAKQFALASELEQDARRRGR